MMRALINKEFRLAMHQTVIIFWAMSAMLLIPAYPYTVVLFYTTLGLFFVCLTGRENHDIEYSSTLPIRKRDIVRARFTFAVMVEVIQLIVAIPFVLIRSGMPTPGNAVGIDANIAFFAFGLVLYGIFNFTFFPRYYRRPDGVGKAFVISGTWVFLFIAVAESSVHVFPFFKDRLDTADPMFLAEKLCAVAVGAVLFALMTWVSYRKSEKSFEVLDL